MLTRRWAVCAQLDDWAAERTFGYTAAEAIGTKSYELFRSKLSPLERAAFLKRIEAGEILRMEAELCAKNGATVWTDLTAIGKRTRDGTLTGLISVNRDITARKRADERFRLAVDAAPAAMISLNCGPMCALRLASTP